MSFALKRQTTKFFSKKTNRGSSNNTRRKQAFDGPVLQCQHWRYTETIDAAFIAGQKTIVMSEVTDYIQNEVFHFEFLIVLVRGCSLLSVFSTIRELVLNRSSNMRDHQLRRENKFASWQYPLHERPHLLLVNLVSYQYLPQQQVIRPPNYCLLSTSSSNFSLLNISLPLMLPKTQGSPIFTGWLCSGTDELLPGCW